MYRSASELILVIFISYVILTDNFNFSFENNRIPEKNVEILLEKKGERKYHDRKNNIRKNLDDIIDKNRKHNFFLPLDCDLSIECMELQVEEGVKKSLIITGDLRDEILGIIGTGCLTNKGKCSNLTIVIKGDGTIDEEKLIKDNSFLKNILDI